MESDGKLKLIIVGLVLAAFAIGYFVIAQRVQKSQTTTPVDVVEQKPTPVPVSSSLPSPIPTPVAGQGNLKGVNSLPNTGFPLPLAGVFATSAVVSGWFLRRFPH